MSESQRGPIDIEMLRVARAPVGGETDISIKNGTQIVDPIPPVLEDYVDELVSKGDIGSVEHGNLGDDSDQKLLLDAVYNADSDQEHAGATTELARSLNERMGGTNSGIGSLFVYKVSLEGDKIPEGGVDAVVLVKMDTEVDRRPYEGEGDDLGEIDEENAYPQSSRLQKGGIYPARDLPPHSRVGDIKIYQRSESDYFRLFFNVKERIPSSLEEGRTVMNACRSVIEDELGRQLTSSDLSIIIDHRDPENGNITKSTLLNALGSISNGAIGEEELSQEFGKTELDELKTNVDGLPRYAKVMIETGDGDVTVKYRMSASDNIQIDSSNNSVSISGSEIEYDYAEK